MKKLAIFALAGLTSCARGRFELPVDPIELTVDSPTYGAFLGAGPIQVEGRISPVDARLFVEDAEVTVASDGRFSLSVPFEDRYRVIDVVAKNGPLTEHVRVPVFDGADPSDTWPGAVTARLTPNGLDRLGAEAAALIDASGWSDNLAAGLTPIGTTGFQLVPVGVSNEPTQVELVPSENGIEALIYLQQLTLDYDLNITLGTASWSAPVALGFEEIAIGVLAVPSLTDGEVRLQLTDAVVDIGEPIVSIGELDGAILEAVIGWVVDATVDPLGELLLGALTENLGEISLGGPYEFETDLLGTAVVAALSNVYADLAGVGLVFGLGVGEPVPENAASVPVPGIPTDPQVDLAVGLHEGLLQALLLGAIEPLLTQNIQLPGVFGEVIGTGIRALPGGAVVPAAEGWCLALQPKPARVVRLRPGVAPFAILYLPDLEVEVGLLQSGTCTPWLRTAMEATVGLSVTDGTKVGLNIQLVDGTVLEYATTGEWEERAVIEQFSTTLTGLLGLLGNFTQFDLADFGGETGGDAAGGLGTVLGGVNLAIVTNEPLVTADGSAVEGLYALGLRLWD